MRSSAPADAGGCLVASAVAALAESLGLEAVAAAPGAGGVHSRRGARASTAADRSAVGVEVLVCCWVTWRRARAAARRRRSDGLAMAIVNRGAWWRMGT